MTSQTTNPPDPQRGELWWVNFEPVIGQETNKTRPALVISSNVMGVLKRRIVIPITGWNRTFEGKLWLVKVGPSTENGLTKESVFDALAVRSVALERFKSKLGHISPDLVDEVAKAVAMVVEAI